MSRGKTEKIVAMGLASIAATLSKLAMDCCRNAYQPELRFYLLPAGIDHRQQHHAA